MHMRRFTRLTNAFSKKLEHHITAISLHFMYYNFVRIHQTLRATPAIAAGVADRVWEIADIVGLLEQRDGTKAVTRRTENLEAFREGSSIGFLGRRTCEICQREPWVGEAKAKPTEYQYKNLTKIVGPNRKNQRLSIEKLVCGR
jgi:hypothetical protein